MTLDVLNIRAGREADARAVAVIETAAFKADWMGYDRLALNISNGEVLVAEIGDRVVGFSVLKCRQGRSTASLVTIAISPAVTGQGFGPALLDAAEHEATRRGFRLMRLEVRADNHRAISFYERAGFFRTGIKPKYYGDGTAAIRMHKRIAPGWWLGQVLDWASFAVARVRYRQA